MAHSRDLAVMDDWTLLFISYFYILMTDRLTNQGRLKLTVTGMEGGGAKILFI